MLHTTTITITIYVTSPHTISFIPCWNLLELSPSWITLIQLSHKWTRILSIISNYNLGICICIQPTIYINSQSNFYNVITLDHTCLCTELHILLSIPNILTIYSEHILQIFPSVYGPFTQVLSEFLFLCIFRQQEPIVTTATFRFPKCQSQNFQPTYISQKIHFKLLQRVYMLKLMLSILDTLICSRNLIRTTSSHRRGIKQLSILHAQKFNFPSFKCNLIQCLDMLYLFTSHIE